MQLDSKKATYDKTNVIISTYYPIPPLEGHTDSCDVFINRTEYAKEKYDDCPHRAWILDPERDPSLPISFHPREIPTDARPIIRWDIRRNPKWDVLRTRGLHHIHNTLMHKTFWNRDRRGKPEDSTSIGYGWGTRANQRGNSGCV